MNFLPTVAHHVPDWINFIGAGVTGLFVVSLLVVAISALTPKSLTWLIEPVVIGYTFFVIIFAMVSVSFYLASSRHNEDNLQNNLSKKYDIVSVDYDSKIAPIKITESESQLITVKLKNDKEGSFLLTQDAWTNEPTLSELPESTVSVADITR